MRTHTAAFLLAAFSLAVPAIAHAEPSETPEPTSSPAPAAPPSPRVIPSAPVVDAPPASEPSEPAIDNDEDDGDRWLMSERRGPYFAGSLGFGMPIHWNRYQGVSESYDGTNAIRSPGFNAGFAVGGAPARGFVLGFMLDTNVGPATFTDHWRQDGGLTGVDHHTGRAHAVGAGFFLHGYIRNFFLRGGFSGMGLFYLDGSSSEANEYTGGVGGDFAIGAHFPVAPKAALGFSAGVRATFWKYDRDDYRGMINILQPLVRFEAVVF